MNEQKTTTWYQARMGKIEAIQVVKYTNSFVTLTNGRREKLTTDWTWIRPNWQEAKNCLIQDAIEKCDEIKNRLRYAERNLSEAKSLIQPL